MKIVVIGGTGLIGSKLVKKLRAHGHEAVAASPDTGVNTLTGEGLAEALGGAPGCRRRGERAGLGRRGGAGVLPDLMPQPARRRGGCRGGAHVALLVVGTDRLPDSVTSARSWPNPGDSPRLAPTRFEDWLALHQPERSFS